jgi:hypothetical protein
MGNIKSHQQSIKKLSQLLNTKHTEVAVWVQEFLLDITEGASQEFQFCSIDEHLDIVQIENLSQMLIEHFYAEDRLKAKDIVEIVSKVEFF